MPSLVARSVKVTGAYASETDEMLRSVLAGHFFHVDDNAVQRPLGGAYAAIAPGEIDIYSAGWPCQPWFAAGNCLESMMAATGFFGVSWTSSGTSVLVQCCLKMFQEHSGVCR